MDRRAFLGSMLKVAAATALPSEIWPFRKIFLPAPRTIVLQENFSWIIDPTLLPLRQGISILQLEQRVRPLYDIYAVAAGKVEWT
jgi:hypothetical protein